MVGTELTDGHLKKKISWESEEYFFHSFSSKPGFWFFFIIWNRDWQSGAEGGKPGRTRMHACSKAKRGIFNRTKAIGENTMAYRLEMEEEEKKEEEGNSDVCSPTNSFFFPLLLLSLSLQRKGILHLSRTQAEKSTTLKWELFSLGP